MDSFANGTVRRWVVVTLIMLSLFLLAAAYAAFRKGAFADDALGIQSTITVSGTGEVVAIPDVARITFSVRSRQSDVPTAQTEVTEKANAVIDAVKDAGVAERDIKTVGYNIYPQYEWQEDRIVCVTFPCPQPPGKQTFVGYDVVQTTEITVRDVEEAGEILQIVGSGNPDTVNGPNFEVDDLEGVRTEARAAAIEDAREQAEALADALDVRLVRILSYGDSGYPIPFYSKDFVGRGVAESDDAIAPLPEVTPGEENIIATVSITYEIR